MQARAEQAPRGQVPHVRMRCGKQGHLGAACTSAGPRHRPLPGSAVPSPAGRAAPGLRTRRCLAKPGNLGADVGATEFHVYTVYFLITIRSEVGSPATAFHETNL